MANDEEPEALVLPSQQLSARPFESLPCNPQVPSPVPTVSSGKSTQESSLTLTETDTADRPISEGEVLFSYGQMLAARGNEVDNFVEIRIWINFFFCINFSSSLLKLHFIHFLIKLQTLTWSLTLSSWFWFLRDLIAHFLVSEQNTSAY